MAFTTSNGRTRTSLAEINITPLVDVVLVLLVIFMITEPVLQSGIEVSVPKTRTVKQITEQRMVVTIDRDQKIFLTISPSTFTIWRRNFTPPAPIRRTSPSISAATSACPLALSRA